MTTPSVRVILHAQDRVVVPSVRWAWNGADIRCNRTGRRIEARSQRGAYRMACLLGLTDWDWWPEVNQGGQA